MSANRVAGWPVALIKTDQPPDCAINRAGSKPDNAKGNPLPRSVLACFSSSGTSDPLARVVVRLLQEVALCCQSGMKIKGLLEVVAPDDLRL
jgi:hypothetical protein